MYIEDNSVIMVERNTSLVEKYEKYLSAMSHRFNKESLPQNGSASHSLWKVAPHSGGGFVEAIKLHSGLNIGMCAYSLNESLYGEACYGTNDSYQFCLLLSGHFILGSSGKRGGETVRGGDLWLGQGPLEKMGYTQLAGVLVKGYSIEMPQSMVDSWLGGGSHSLSRRLELHIKGDHGKFSPCLCGIRPLARSINASHPLMQLSHRLYLMQRNTIYDHLRFEALVLDILAELLTVDSPLQTRSSEDRSRRQKAVDDTLDILNDEWASPPTILSLARRVGVNECYLKTDFRRQTGLSIGAYVRKLRMEKALEFIESGQFSILQVALYVGYSNPSHFSEAFKRYHGRLPSFYTRKKRSLRHPDSAMGRQHCPVR